MDSNTARWNDDRVLPIIRNMSPLKFFAQSGFSNKCCPIAESQVLVVILDLQDRGGCPLWGWVLFLILDGNIRIYVSNIITLGTRLTLNLLILFKVNLVPRVPFHTSSVDFCLRSYQGY